jgi:hypothetical protein
MKLVIPEELRVELADLSDAEIEVQLPNFNEKKRRLVRALLDEKWTTRARDAQAEQTDIARSAKDAAWVSAKASEGANKRATVAIIISIFSVLIAAAGLVVAIVALHK